MFVFIHSILFQQTQNLMNMAVIGISKWYINKMLHYIWALTPCSYLIDFFAPWMQHPHSARIAEHSRLMQASPDFQWAARKTSRYNDGSQSYCSSSQKRSRWKADRMGGEWFSLELLRSSRKNSSFLRPDQLVRTNLPFFKPDGPSKQNLKIFANVWGNPNTFGKFLENLSEHIDQNFGILDQASSPIIGGPGFQVRCGGGDGSRYDLTHCDTSWTSIMIKN